MTFYLSWSLPFIETCTSQLKRVCSQVFVFSEMRHPKYQWYTQCLTFRVLPTHGQQVMYSMVGVVTMYIAPLVTIIFCYSAIILEICKRVVDTGKG
jgi:hypothetical protein